MCDSSMTRRKSDGSNPADSSAGCQVPGRRCVGSSSQCPSRSRSAASSRRRGSWCASAIAAPPATAAGARARRADRPARTRSRRWPAPSAWARDVVAGREEIHSRSSVTTSPVRGCSVLSFSISSPKNSTRTASSHTSETPRGCPPAPGRSRGCRRGRYAYWMPTNRRSSASLSKFLTHPERDHPGRRTPAGPRP